MAEWLKKYGQIPAYTTAVVILTAFAIRFDAKFNQGNEQLVLLNTRLDALQIQVSSLQDLARDREKYDRWRKQANIRMKRLYNIRGWDYEDIE